MIGVGLGMVAAIHRNRPSTRSCGVVSLAGLSMPTFWLALVALYFFFFRLGWFPGQRAARPRAVTRRRTTTGLYTLDALIAGDWASFRRALAAPDPAGARARGVRLGLLTRFTRSAVLEVLGNDYVRAARAKGLPERMSLVRHVLRAALPPS